MTAPAVPWRWSDPGPEPPVYKKRRKDQKFCAHCGEPQGRYLRRFCVSCELRVCVDCTADSIGPTSLGGIDLQTSGFLSHTRVVCSTCASYPSVDVRLERSGKWWDTREGSEFQPPEHPVGAFHEAVRSRDDPKKPTPRRAHRKKPRPKLKKITDLTAGERQVVITQINIWVAEELWERGLLWHEMTPFLRRFFVRTAIRDRLREVGVEPPRRDEL